MPIRFDPLRELDRLAQSLGQALGRLGPVRAARSDDELRLDIDLPGVKAQDIEPDVGATGGGTDPAPPPAGEQANPLPTS